MSLRAYYIKHGTILLTAIAFSIILLILFSYHLRAAERDCAMINKFGNDLQRFIQSESGLFEVRGIDSHQRGKVVIRYRLRGSKERFRMITVTPNPLFCGS